MRQRLQKLLLPPLALLLILLSSDCAQLPPLPQGNLYIDNQATQSMIGTSIEGAVNGTPSTVPSVPLNQTDKWICFDPVSWTNIQTYIEELTTLAKQQCQGQ